MARTSPQAQRLKDTAARATGYPKSFFTARTATRGRGENKTYEDADLDLNLRQIYRSGYTHRDVHEAMADKADEFAKANLTVNVHHNAETGQRRVSVSSAYNPQQKVSEWRNNPETGSYERRVRDVFNDRRSG